MLELIFVGLDLDPSDHIDPSLIDDQKESDIQKKKLNKRLSSGADFESPKFKTKDSKQKKTKVNDHSNPSVQVMKGISQMHSVGVPAEQVPSRYTPPPVVLFCMLLFIFKYTI